MRIVLLGFGEEIFFFLKKMNSKINIVGYGVSEKYTNQAKEIIDFCFNNKIPVIKSHNEIPKLKPDIVFMISYAPLIEEEYLVKYKFINMHGALLPEYRGLHGGTWAIINGEKYHGYTIHQVDEGIDSGSIYHQGLIESTIEDTIITIRNKILTKFKEEIAEVFLKIISNQIIPMPQDELKAKYVSKRKPDDGLIDWENSALEIHNLVRALTPPYTEGAFTYWKNEKLFIVSSEYIDFPVYISTIGQVVAKYPGRGVLVKCKDKPLLIKEVNFKGIGVNAFDLFKTVGARLL